MKLLLVEDDPSMQITLQRTLGRRRIDVRVCGDGAEAVALWRAIEPDVVALDLSLPNLDGLQVLAQARAEGLRTPVLLLTARGTVGDRIVGSMPAPTTTCPSHSISTSWKPASARCGGAARARDPIPASTRRRSAACASSPTTAPSTTAPICWSSRRASWR
jgi:CheY-like chemotaxis protein